MPRLKTVYAALVPLGYPKVLDSLKDPALADKLARLAERCLILKQMSDERRDSGFLFPFSRESGRAMFGGAWDVVKRGSIETGLLDWHDKYSTGYEENHYESFPKSCRLTERYASGRFERYTLSAAPRGKADGWRRGPVEEALFDRLSLFSVRDDATSECIWHALSIELWRSRKLYSTVCDFGRLHTNMTSTPRDVRRQIVGTGELYSLDVKNSQPLILSLVLRNIASPSELSEWQSVCERGECYETLLEMVKASGKTQHEVVIPAKEKRTVDGKLVVRRERRFTVDAAKWTRDNIKKEVLTMLFGTIDQTKASPVFQAIEKWLPSVAQAVTTIKSDGYQILAQRCQRAESDLLIRSVGKAMLRHSGSIGTIHDAWVVPEYLTAAARDAMMGEFRSVGLSPTLKVESLVA